MRRTVLVSRSSADSLSPRSRWMERMEPASPVRQTAVDLLDQRKAVRAREDRALHLVHRVAEAEQCVGICEAHRAARARMPEGAWIRTERDTRMCHEVAEAEAGAQAEEDAVGPEAVLGVGARDALAGEHAHAVELAAARQRRVDARHRACVAVSVRRGHLGHAPGTRVGEPHRGSPAEDALGAREDLAPLTLLDALEALAEIRHAAREAARDHAAPLAALDE